VTTFAANSIALIASLTIRKSSDDPSPMVAVPTAACEWLAAGAL
jgi:hypothetical protein